MEEASTFTIANNNNLSGKDWFLDGIDYDTVISIPLDASEGGLFTGNFVPPPPRPLFLDGATPDGLTTCDLCSWAWQKDNTNLIDTRLEVSGDLGWVLTLIIVSLISALIGAIVMITVLHCKRLKNTNTLEPDLHAPSIDIQLRPNRPPINTPDDKTLPSPTYHTSQTNINGVWSWLSRRTPSSQLENPPPNFVENHYTHMEETYGTNDSLYAELDVDSTVERDSNSPAYHNSAYTDPDVPSAPSSAYYSDLSVTTVPDRAYEVVGLATMPFWSDETKKGSAPRLAAISENSTVPSDYV